MTRHRALLLLTFLAGSAAALALGELLLRLLRPRLLAVPASRAEEFFAFDPGLGWTNRPNGHGRMTFLPDFDHEIRINGRGLRDREFAAVPPAGTRRVLCLGDSFTWGMGVEAEETWPKVLERSLRGAEAMNAGVNAWTTSQELLWLRREGLTYRPDAVVVGFYVNDFEENLDEYAGIYRRPYFVLEAGRLVLKNVPVVQPEGARWLPRGAWLQNHSYLFRLGLFGWDWVRRGFLERTELSPLPRRDPSRPAALGGPEAPPALDVTRALLAELERTSRESGALFAVLLIPANRQVRPSLRSMPAAPAAAAAYEAARGICRELGLVAADPLDALRASEERGLPVYHRMDMHWNAAGHRLAGELVARLLAPRLAAP
ncbi:MAG TPA: SGNH/GDSL hydrolase family protein [Thermoanaerobaculia bacterium]|nr:SGNH/GDSL hydrolase family protein [Thermoanaerobaculia bacterium]